MNRLMSKFTEKTPWNCQWRLSPNRAASIATTEALATVVVTETDAAGVDELLNTYWDERADEMSEHDAGGVA